MIVKKLVYQSIDIEDCTVTLLSKEEYEKNSYLINTINDCWWLRSRGYGVINAMFVDGASGDVNDRGCNTLIMLGVRPALKIAYCEQLKPGEKIKIKELYFTVLNNGILLCDSIVSKIMFNDKINDYGTSYIKKWLENWFNNKCRDQEFNNEFWSEWF